MGIGFSLFLLTVGAVLTWAVDYEVSGIDLNTVGVILLVVGAVAFVGSVVFARRAHTVVEDRRVV